MVVVVVVTVMVMTMKMDVKMSYTDATDDSKFQFSPTNYF